MEPSQRCLSINSTIFQDYLYLETLFRLEYAPQNSFCFALDRKASTIFKTRIKALQTCFSKNMFVVNDGYEVHQTGHNSTVAHLSCLKKLRKRNFKYVFLVHNFDVKLRTNAELVEILKNHHGANEMYTTFAPNYSVAADFSWKMKHLNLFPKNHSKCSQYIRMPA